MLSPVCEITGMPHALSHTQDYWDYPCLSCEATISQGARHASRPIQFSEKALFARVPGQVESTSKRTRSIAPLQGGGAKRTEGDYHVDQRSAGRQVR